MAGAGGEKSKKEERKKQEQLHQKQLELFTIPDIAGSGLSHTIEFLSSAPRFVRGKNLTRPRSYEGRLNLVRTYEDKINQVPYRARVTISPAILSVTAPEPLSDEQGDAGEVFVYPGSDVEILEKIFIKLGTRGQGRFSTDNRGRPVFGVRFTINQIVKELRELGKSRRPEEVLRAIEVGVNARVTIEVESPDKKDCWEITDGIFSNFIRVKREQYEDGGEADKTCFVALHPLVVKCLQDQTFRKFDYAKNLSYKSPLTRWLHEKLSHKYVYAASGLDYNFRLTTFLQLYGAPFYQRIADNHKEFKEALDELRDDGVLDRWDYELIRDPRDRRRTVDYKYSCWASEAFVKRIILFNVEKSQRIEDYKKFLAQNTSQDL